MKWILSVILVPVSVYASWEDRQAFETAMVHALENKEELLSVAFTNQLTRFIQSDASEGDRATAILVLSISISELFEKYWDVAMYEQNCNIASNIFSFTGLEENSWQKLYAHLSLASSDTMNDQYASAYTILAKALRIIEGTGYTEPTNRVWKAILVNYYKTPDITLQQLILLYAGLSMAKLEYVTEARAFVTGFPLRYREMIEAVIAEDKAYMQRAIQEQRAELAQPPVAMAKAKNRQVLLMTGLLCASLILCIGIMLYKMCNMRTNRIER